MTTEHCHACGRKIGLLAVRYRYRGNVYCEMHEPLTGAHAMTDYAPKHVPTYTCRAVVALGEAG